PPVAGLSDGWSPPVAALSDGVDMMTFQVLVRAGLNGEHCAPLAGSLPPAPSNSTQSWSIGLFGRVFHVTPRGPTGVLFVTVLAVALGLGLAFFQGNQLVAALNDLHRLLSRVIIASRSPATPNRTPVPAPPETKPDNQAPIDPSGLPRIKTDTAN